MASESISLRSIGSRVERTSAAPDVASFLTQNQSLGSAAGTSGEAAFRSVLDERMRDQPARQSSDNTPRNDAAGGNEARTGGKNLPRERQNQVTGRDDRSESRVSRTESRDARVIEPDNRAPRPANDRRVAGRAEKTPDVEETAGQGEAAMVGEVRADALPAQETSALPPQGNGSDGGQAGVEDTAVAVDPAVAVPMTAVPVASVEVVALPVVNPVIARVDSHDAEPVVIDNAEPEVPAGDLPVDGVAQFPPVSAGNRFVEGEAAAVVDGDPVLASLRTAGGQMPAGSAAGDTVANSAAQSAEGSGDTSESSGLHVLKAMQAALQAGTEVDAEASAETLPARAAMAVAKQGELRAVAPELAAQGDTAEASVSPEAETEMPAARLQSTPAAQTAAQTATMMADAMSARMMARSSETAVAQPPAVPVLVTSDPAGTESSTPVVDTGAKADSGLKPSPGTGGVINSSALNVVNTLIQDAANTREAASTGAEFDWEQFDFAADELPGETAVMAEAEPEVVVDAGEEQMRQVRNELRTLERLVESGAGPRNLRDKGKDDQLTELKTTVTQRVADAQGAAARTERATAVLAESPLSPRRGGFAEQMAEKVIMMATRNVQSAEIRLDPKELGTIDVKIRVQHDQAQVVFSSQNAQVRDTLEASLPRLREMFAEAGIGLGDVNVSDRGTSAGGGREQGDGRRGGDVMGDDADASVQNVARPARRPEGMVDYYA